MFVPRCFGTGNGLSCNPANRFFAPEESPLRTILVLPDVVSVCTMLKYQVSFTKFRLFFAKNPIISSIESFARHHDLVSIVLPYWSFIIYFTDRHCVLCCLLRAYTTQKGCEIRKTNMSLLQLFLYNDVHKLVLHFSCLQNTADILKYSLYTSTILYFISDYIPATIFDA